MVRIPVTLASPSTNNAVVAVPACTSNPLLKVLRPRESTCVTSSYVIVPATFTFPVASISPSTNSLTSALAVVPIPTFLDVLTPTESDAQVPAPPVSYTHLTLPTKA